MILSKELHVSLFNYIVKQEGFVHQAQAQANTRHQGLHHEHWLFYYEWHHPGEQEVNAQQPELSGV